MTSKANLLSFGLCLFSLLIGSCSKHEGSYMSSGTVIGYDMALCACCGGLLMEMDADTAQPGNRIIKFENDSEWGFTEMDTYPVRVQFDYTPLQDFCGRRVIKITRLRLE